jgi:hypothetical protein
VFEVSVPAGATVAAVALNANGLSPPQFAPFPSFAVGGTHGYGTDGGDLLSSGAAMCHGSDKNHLYSFGPGGLASATQPCFTLASGPVYLSWPSSESPTGQSALVASAADSFHLNYNRVGDAGQGAHSRGIACMQWHSVHAPYGPHGAYESLFASSVSTSILDFEAHVPLE